MLTRAHLFEDIVARLSILRYAIGSNSKLGLLNLNKQAEVFYQQIFNLVLDKELEVLERLVKNHPAIDLGDKKNRLCIQVTSENSSTKIHETLKAFGDHKLDQHYDRLVVFMLTTKKAYTTTFSDAGSLKFDNEDIWDVDDILAKIEALDSEKMEKVRNLIDREMMPLVKMLAPNSLLAQLAPVPSKAPVNGSALRRHSGLSDVPDKDWTSDLNSIISFYKKYAKLAPDTRAWVYLVALYGSIENDLIMCPGEVLKSHLQTGSINTLYTAAYHTGFADTEVMDDDIHAYRLSYTLESEAPIFTWLRDFCSTGKKPNIELDEKRLHALLVDCDFTLLDD